LCFQRREKERERAAHNAIEGNTARARKVQKAGFVFFVFISCTCVCVTSSFCRLRQRRITSPPFKQETSCWDLIFLDRFRHCIVVCAPDQNGNFRHWTLFFCRHSSVQCLKKPKIDATFVLFGVCKSRSW
jgi:hypothetical protein